MAYVSNNLTDVLYKGESNIFKDMRGPSNVDGNQTSFPRCKKWI